MSLITHILPQASKKALDPVAPIYKYCAISVSNILTTTCQYEVIEIFGGVENLFLVKDV